MVGRNPFSIRASSFQSSTTSALPFTTEIDAKPGALEAQAIAQQLSPSGSGPVLTFLACWCSPGSNLPVPSCVPAGCAARAAAHDGRDRSLAGLLQLRATAGDSTSWAPIQRTHDCSCSGVPKTCHFLPCAAPYEGLTPELEPERRSARLS